MKKPNIEKRLAHEIARKSDLDRDKELMADALKEIKRLRNHAYATAYLVAACKDCLEGRGDWVSLMTAAIAKFEAEP